MGGGNRDGLDWDKRIVYYIVYIHLTPEPGISPQMTHAMLHILGGDLRNPSFPRPREGGRESTE